MRQIKNDDGRSTKESTTSTEAGGIARVLLDLSAIGSSSSLCKWNGSSFLVDSVTAAVPVGFATVTLGDASYHRGAYALCSRVGVFGDDPPDCTIKVA